MYLVQVPKGRTGGIPQYTGPSPIQKREPGMYVLTLDRVIINNLHLFLWVSDVLIDQLIMELLSLDALDKAKQVIQVKKTRGAAAPALELLGRLS